MVKMTVRFIYPNLIKQFRKTQNKSHNENLMTDKVEKRVTKNLIYDSCWNIYLS